MQWQCKAKAAKDTNHNHEIENSQPHHQPALIIELIIIEIKTA
jgi:hypothetical protein